MIDIISPVSLFTPFGGEVITPPVVVTAEPNPAETAWTLGVGGAVSSLSLTPGFGVTYNTILKNAGVVVPYTSAATLDAVVWRGGQSVTLFNPAVAWLNPGNPIDGALSLSFGPTQAQTLDAGTYNLRVGVTSGGARVVAYDGTLQIMDSPGSLVAPLVWCSQQDMLLRSDQIRSLLSSKVAQDTSGFLAQRQQATLALKRMLLDRYNPRFGFVKVRQNVVNPASGSMDVASPTAAAPSKADITKYLNAGGMILEEKVREITARMAIALILQRQATSSGGQPYITEAAYQNGEADALFRNWQAQIDSSSPLDGVADMLIDMDVILLPEGTAP